MELKQLNRFYAAYVWSKNPIERKLLSASANAGFDGFSENEIAYYSNINGLPTRDYVNVWLQCIL